ncbi:MAG: SWIM zinc finger family protein [Rhizobiales bacterium]|nr:SWIM zinc finger family protein [Hyphomicrobiales bacterium]
MTGGKSPRFDIEALRSRVGGTIFARGEAYCRDGRVKVLDVNKDRILATIDGTETYRAELTGRGKAIDGECSCPFFEDNGFCKHLVAIALAVNNAAPDSGQGAFSRLRPYLKEKGIESLVDMILQLAERDPVLFAKLETEAALATADDPTLEAQLRKSIDRVTHTNRFIDYGEAPAWAARIDSLLDNISSLATGKRANLALKLIERLIDRIEKCIGSIDDSDGHCGMLIGRACDIHLTAARVAKPDGRELARMLFNRELKSDYASFSGSLASYADLLGDEGLTEYRRLATVAWEKLAARRKKPAAYDEGFASFHTLLGMMDYFAERDGDVDARIAFRAKDLSSPWNYLQLAEFCVSQGRKDEALRRAEEGLWMFEDDRPDERLVLFAARLLVEAKRKEDALSHLQKAFDKAPSIELYKQISKLGGGAARLRATGVIEELARRDKSGWHRFSDLLVDIYVTEKAFDEAWAVVGKYGASMAAKFTLAQKSEKLHTARALEVYAQQVDLLAKTGGNDAYEGAAKLIKRMAGLWTPGEHAAFVKSLKERHGKKRNLMKLLG